jgi:hypothetical protein
MCRFCHNIGREHNSNRIFFVVDACGIEQRCHDSAEEATEEMKFGLCKNYGGRLGEIPQPLVTRLFSKCPAAKSLGQGALLDSMENDEEEDIEELGLRIQRDKKTRKLYEIGDQICQELYVSYLYQSLTKKLILNHDSLHGHSTPHPLQVSDKLVLHIDNSRWESCYNTTKSIDKRINEKCQVSWRFQICTL